MGVVAAALEAREPVGGAAVGEHHEGGEPAVGEAGGPRVLVGLIARDGAG